MAVREHRVAWRPMLVRIVLRASCDVVVELTLEILEIILLVVLMFLAFTLKLGQVGRALARSVLDTT